MPVFLTSDIDAATKNVIYTVNELYKSNLFLSSVKENITIKSAFQNFLNFKFENKLESLIYKLILENCFLAERLSAGGFFATLKNVIDSSETKKVFIDEKTFHPKFSDIESVVSKYIHDSRLKSLLLEAIKISGFHGKIVVEKSSNDSASLEVSSFYEFKCKTFNSPIRMLQPKVVTIDGFVESVSELNKIFEEAANSKHQVVIFARGFHDDVLTTAEVNRKRSTMFVYPISMPFDLDGINSIVDISVIAGVNPTSSNLGQLISSASLSDSSTIDEISINKNSVSIRNKKTKHQVRIHLKNLMKKLDSSPGAEEVYEARMKKLADNKCIIRIPDSNSFIADSQSVDYCLRAIKSLLDFGICKDGEIFATKKVSQEFSEKIFNTIQNLGAIIVE